MQGESILSSLLFSLRAYQKERGEGENWEVYPRRAGTLLLLQSVSRMGTKRNAFSFWALD